MNLLSIIEKIYENSYFSTILVIAIVVLIALFIIVLFLGIKDAKKSKQPIIEQEEDIKDVTFENIKEVNAIKEDITFEIPKLTQNLENFKKKLEEEIQKEDNAQIRKTTGLTLNKDQKSIKILDRTQIERTTLIPVIKNVEKIEQETKVKKTQKNNDDF